MMDLFTVEVIQRLLLSAAEEIGLVLVRTAYSPNIKERRDASAAVFDCNGALVAQAAHIPMHLSSMMELPPLLQTAYPRKTWRPGDMFIANDPYVSAGSHLNDVAVIAPVIIRRRLVAFVANVAHHSDIGGRVPGSESGDSISIFQEGIRLPLVRICRAGRVEDGLLRTILLNSRTARERAGDLRAQIAANRAGLARIAAISSEYGPDRLAQGMSEILDYTERRIRLGIAKIPDGVYAAEGFCDDDGCEARSVRVQATVRIEGDQATIDFTGTDPQVRGAKNVPTVSLLATVYYVLKALVDPDLPPNCGYYRVIAVWAPEGSVLNPKCPAAVGARFTTCQKVADVLLSAFAKAVPDRVIAHSHGATLAIYSGTNAPSGDFFVDYEVYAGGGGARATKDGLDGVANHMTNTSNLPIEVLESEFPLMVERYELIPDSGGPGRFRGGLGVMREIRGTKGDLTISGWGCDHRLPAAGVFGGESGVPGAFCVLDEAGKVVETVRSTIPGIHLTQSRRLRICTSGGGGFGEARTRDASLVEGDVREGKISVDAALTVYGVALRADGCEADAYASASAEAIAAEDPLL